MAVLNAHLAMPVVGTPMPRPTTVVGPAAFVSITVTVPAVLPPNDRDMATLGVSRLAKTDVVGPLGVVGVVVVESLPHALISETQVRTATSGVIRPRILMAVTGAPRESCSQPRFSNCRRQQFSR